MLSLLRDQSTAHYALWEFADGCRGRQVRQDWFSFFVVSAFGGCAQHTWTPGPGLRLSDFEPAKAECSMMARNGGSGFAAYGQASYVAGAALGHAIGESIRAQANFNDCLSAKGWRKTTPESLAASQVKTEIVKAAAMASRECIANVRSQDRYTPIQHYFTDPTTGKHTMVQLSNDRRATPVEAQLLSSYIDDIGPCLDRRHAEYEKHRRKAQKLQDKVGAPRSVKRCC